MSIDRWTDKEALVHIHDGKSLSHKKEHGWVSWSEVDEPRACYTDWCKSEKQILYINAYIWNLDIWCWGTHLQGRNRYRDTENRLVDTAGRGKGGTNCESSTETYPSPNVRQTASGKLLRNQGAQANALWQPRGAGARFKREGTCVYFWLIHDVTKHLPSN